MDGIRMSNEDMLRYCDEALAWEDFGPVDIYFFESVKKILLGECSAEEEPEENREFADIKRPVTSAELEPEYKNFPDVYYNNDSKSEKMVQMMRKNVFRSRRLSAVVFSARDFLLLLPKEKGTERQNRQKKTVKKKTAT